MLGRSHTSCESRVDGTESARCDDGRFWFLICRRYLRHEQQTRTSDSGHGVLGVWLPFCGAGSVETYGGGILVVVEGDAAIPGVFGPQRGVPPGWVPCFCWLKQEEDEEEPTPVQKHSREGYNIAA